MPQLAFIIAGVTSAILISLLFVRSYYTHIQTNGEHYQRVSALIAGDLAMEAYAEVDAALKTVAPQKAAVLNSDNAKVAGTLTTQAGRSARIYPIVYQGEQIGQLVAAPMTAYVPPIPYAIAIAIVALYSLIGAFFARIYAGLVSTYLSRITDIVNNFSVQGPMDYKREPLSFAEFRTLNVATIRTTRRVAKEIKTLRTSAQYDSRSGLLNEHALNTRLEGMLPQVDYAKPAALIVLELSGYATGTQWDTTNHVHAGSKTIPVLKATIEKIEQQRGIAPGTWSIASLVTDQFAILLNDFGQRDEIASIAREIQNAFRTPIKFGERSISITVFGSIVLIPEDGDSVTQIRQRADATILDLKRQSKTGFSFYSPKLERQRDAMRKLESELRQAVDQDRFVPLFQPKVDLRTGRIFGSEALARWQLDSGRLASPSVFIDLAEETGLISLIGEQIMRKACMETAELNQRGHRVSVAVNVSPKQFEREGLSQMILDALAKSGLSPRQLEIEITESLAIQHPERVRSVLKPLRKLGIKLAVDDFGTGHSNLATLTRLDFDVFKIDRQFVAGTPNDRQANAIVDMILSMAKTLEMQIVGEGIETERQAAFLKAQGCDVGQGYLFSPPVTASAYRKLIEEQPFLIERLRA
ncbi:MAG: GGDEF domain-containing phosphodiesterase [Pseudomonadota bacterium]